MGVRIPGRTWVDAWLGGAVTVVVAVAITANVGGARPPAIAYVFALAFGALLLLRRPYPVLCLVATALGLIGYYLFDLPPIGLALPVAAALYSAAEAGRVWWAVGAATTLTVLATAFRLREGDAPDFVLGVELTSTIGLMVAAIALGDGARSRRRLRAELRRNAELAAAEREREATRRVEAERVWIARELHDVLGHSVAVISLHASVATEGVAEGDRSAVVSALAAIRGASGEAMAELRATVRSLRGGDARRAPSGGLDQLDRLAATVSGSGLPVTVHRRGSPVPVPDVVEGAAYRVVQEALTNALRHAGASHVTVTLHYAGDELRITVVDDGHGIGTSDGNEGAQAITERGEGLRGMAERVTLLGGTVQAGSAEGGGFRVAVALPLTSAARSEGAVVTG
jgi:signal transduction histidine kinase